MKAVQPGTNKTDLLLSVELDQPFVGGTPPDNPAMPTIQPLTPQTGFGKLPANPPHTDGGNPGATAFSKDIRLILEAHCI